MKNQTVVSWGQYGSVEGPGEGLRLGRGCQPGGTAGGPEWSVMGGRPAGDWGATWHRPCVHTKACSPLLDIHLLQTFPGALCWPLWPLVGLRGLLCREKPEGHSPLLSPLHPSMSSQKHLSNVSGNQKTGHIYTAGMSGLIHSRQPSGRSSYPFGGDSPPVSWTASSSFPAITFPV